MSSEDQVRPYHAKDEPRGQEAADAVAAVLKHAAEKDKAAHAKPQPRKQPKWLLPLGINLGVLAVYLLIAPPRWVVVNPIDPPDLALITERTSTALWMQAQRIEAFKLQNGRLPESLAEAGSPADGVEYVRQGDQYQLIAMVEGTPLVYDSAGPNSEILAIAGRRLTGG